MLSCAIKTQSFTPSYFFISLLSISLKHWGCHSPYVEMSYTLIHWKKEKPDRKCSVSHGSLCWLFYCSFFLSHETSTQLMYTCPASSNRMFLYHFPTWELLKCRGNYSPYKQNFQKASGQIFLLNIILGFFLLLARFLRNKLIWFLLPSLPYISSPFLL